MKLFLYKICDERLLNKVFDTFFGVGVKIWNDEM